MKGCICHFVNIQEDASVVAQPERSETLVQWLALAHATPELRFVLRFEYSEFQFSKMFSHPLAKTHPLLIPYTTGLVNQLSSYHP